MNRPTRFFSNKQEKHIAKELGGRQTANSGATKFQKGDVTTSDWLIEAKTVTKPVEAMSVKREWLKKNAEEAFAMSKRFNAVAIDFGQNDNYYIVDEKTFKRLVEAVKE